MQATFCFSDDLKSTAANPSCLSNYLKSQNPLQPAPSPVEEGWGEGIPRMAATFINTLTIPIQALRLVALSLTLSHGREDGWLLRLGVLQKNGCAGCFFAFQTTCINGCKSKLLFKPPATAKSAAICPPRGGGLGRGPFPNRGNLSQHPNRPNTSLAACCPLSNSLPRERGRGGCWD